MNGRNIGDYLIEEVLAQAFHCSTRCPKMPDQTKVIDSYDL